MELEAHSWTITQLLAIVADPFGCTAMVVSLFTGVYWEGNLSKILSEAILVPAGNDTTGCAEGHSDPIPGISIFVHGHYEPPALLV